MPTNASCAFAPKQVTLSGNNQSVNVGLTINATAQQAGKHAPQSPLNPTLFALVFWWPGGLTGLAVFLRRRNLVKTRPLLAALPAARIHMRLGRWSIELRYERQCEWGTGDQLPK